jgi:hypothetical protein
VRTLAGAVWLLLAALESAAQGTLDGWLPEETLFCLSVEDRSRSTARLAAGPGRFRGDPAVQRLAVETKVLLAEARRECLARGEVWLGPFWNLARGQIVLAVVRARGAEAPLVLLDLGDQPGAFRAHLRRLARAGVLGLEILRDHEGETVHTRPGSEGTGAVFWIQRGSRVAFSWRAGAVEAVVDRLRGAKGVAARRDFSVVRAKLPRDADAVAWLPGEALAELAARSDDVRGLLDVLGLRDDGALGLALTFAPDALEVRAFLLAPRPRRRLLALLDGIDGPLEAPPLPRGTRAFLAARLDLRGVLALAEETLSPDERTALRRLLDGEEGELATSFVRALGDEFALAYVGSEAVLVAEVDREASLRRLLASVTGARGNLFRGPDGALALRDGWLFAAARPDLVAAAPEALPALAAAASALPERRAMLWVLAPAPPRRWDDPAALFGAQAGALANDPDGLLLLHRALWR